MDNYEDTSVENQEQEVLVKRPDHRMHRKEKDPNRYFVLRNWLNTFFVLGAIVGMCVFLWQPRHRNIHRDGFYGSEIC